MRHRSLVSAICSQRRQSDKRKKRQREVQRGKLFACESKDFSDHSCSESHRKRRRKRTRSHVLRRTTSFPVLSVTWTLCSRLIHQTEEDMKTGKKSFIGRCSFNSLCYETVWGITCSLSAPQQGRMLLETCNCHSCIHPTIQASKYCPFCLHI